MQRLIALSALALGLHAACVAQVQRQFPAKALRGELVIEAPPVVSLNGEPARLSPGSRIRDRNNMIQLSASLVGQPLTVHYTREMSGMIGDVWILRPEEAAVRPWPRTPGEAEAWRFDPTAQRWTRP